MSDSSTGPRATGDATSRRISQPVQGLRAVLTRLVYRVRRKVTYWSERRSGPPAPGEPAAIGWLRSDEPRCRWEGAEALARNSQRSSEAIAALAVAMADAEPFVRWQAAEALAAQQANRVFPVLRGALADSERLRRQSAAEALGLMGGEAAALTLSEHGADPDSGVRAEVARALGMCGDPTCVSVLIPMLADESSDVRRAGAGALGRGGNLSAAAPLAAALAQPGQQLLVRRALAAALARLPHPDVQPALLAALGDPDPQVRGYAAQALGQIDTEASHAALLAAKQDTGKLLEGTVADRAKAALAMLERRGRRAAPSGGTTEVH